MPADASSTTHQDARAGSRALRSGVIAITPLLLVAITTVAVQLGARSDTIAGLRLLLLVACPVPVLILAFLAIQDGSAELSTTRPRPDARPAAQTGHTAAVAGIALGSVALVSLGIAIVGALVWLATY